MELTPQQVMLLRALVSPATDAALRGLTGLREEEVRQGLEALSGAGLAQRGAEGAWALTEAGRLELYVYNTL